MRFSCLSPKAYLLGALVGLARFVFADCECGYSVNPTDERDHTLFTDILESDFTTLKDIRADKDWVLQEWKIDKSVSRGPYGRMTVPGNAISNPAKDLAVSDEGVLGREAGLELYVRKLQPGDQYVSIVEADSYRADMIYGSFRAGIKTTGISGTCGAFFWYLNDTQEIDIEFLSSQLNDTTSPVNLVLHSSLSKGGDASGTPTFKVIQLPFEADKAVHEYRFDWQPHRVSFYADGQWLTDMTEEEYIPSVPGKIILSHWSNGNKLWSGGPPIEDAFMLVQYVKAYFNTSSEERMKDYAVRCKNSSASNAICEVPDQNGPPIFGGNDPSQRPYFFSQDASKNKTVNQTYGKVESTNKNAATPLLAISGYAVLTMAILLAAILEVM
ncbi:glycoside hydrolase family 16 protein [Terfezia boudieri ATCC MYA-4762]|uniref:Glycoside hydrolase family 16 protein n=1 Tax=Terfezia boudieri ATCC MYA-4762 TaxID=1051890 RepID=A0A3N4MR43_9PEZI|nr:glycoside hydrolase family 16 protein [Terfezia boudieri ATCC MYA-4762]